MTTALVTGATGFVGRELSSRLLHEGLAVRGAVRSLPAPGVLAAGVTPVVVGEIGPGTRWEKCLEGVDVVFHLAARVHQMRDTATDPEAEYRRVNAEGTSLLARQAARAGVRRLVLVSTTKVLGEGRREPYGEADPAAPVDAYGRSKWAAERAVMEAAAASPSMRAIVVRPPLVYGPGVKANFLRLLEAVDRGTPLPFASIRNRRSLVHVGNLADALWACATAPLGASRTYLVSDGEDVSTPELVRRMARALGRPARLLPVPPSLLRLGAALVGRRAAADRLIESLSVDPSAIRSELGWEPPYDLDEGLARTVAWFRSRPR